MRLLVTLLAGPGAGTHLISAPVVPDLKINYEYVLEQAHEAWGELLEEHYGDELPECFIPIDPPPFEWEVVVPQ